MNPEEIEEQHGRDGEQHLTDGRFAEAIEEFQAVLAIARERGDSGAEAPGLPIAGSRISPPARTARRRSCSSTPSRSRSNRIGARTRSRFAGA